MAKATTIIRASLVKIVIDFFNRKRLKLNKVILFGSFAKNQNKKHSDIDLIIISQDFRNKSIFERAELMVGLNRELVRKTQKPIDILYYSDEEWEEGNSLIINEAKKDGILIYG